MVFSLIYLLVIPKQIFSFRTRNIEHIFKKVIQFYDNLFLDQKQNQETFNKNVFSKKIYMFIVGTIDIV